MKIQKYVSRSEGLPEEIDPAEEFETVDRVFIDSEEVTDQVSVKYRPSEIIDYLVEDSDVYGFEIPETTVLVIDEDEIIDRESVIEAKDLDRTTIENTTKAWDTDVPIKCNGETVEVNT